METSDPVLITVAVLILLGAILSAVSRRLKQPPVIGLLLLGVLLGPSALQLVHSNEIITWLSKLGVLFLLFEAGIETDIQRIKEDSKKAMFPALGGVVIPFILGFSFSWYLFQNLFHALTIACIFTATSVSVSVMTLMDLGKFKGVEGRVIVNAAILDDIVGILLVTFIFGMGATGASAGSPLVGILISVGQIIGFFVLATVAGLYIIRPLFRNLVRLHMDHVIITIVCALIFIYAWLAEESGIAGITGAYLIGLFLGQTNYKHLIQEQVATVGKSFFVPIFFIHIGLEFNLLACGISTNVIIGFILLAMGGKILGSGLGARLAGFDWLRSSRIGIGMVPRGEVALIIASMGLQRGFIKAADMSLTVLIVIITAILTPLLLKFVFTKFSPRTF